MSVHASSQERIRVDDEGEQRADPGYSVILPKRSVPPEVTLRGIAGSGHLDTSRGLSFTLDRSIGFGLSAQYHLGCAQAHLLHLGDKVVDTAGVLDPFLHERELVRSDSDAEGLAGDLPSPLNVWAVRLTARDQDYKASDREYLVESFQLTRTPRLQ